MILVDTGPFIALFDPRDPLHSRCKTVLCTLQQPLSTTVPVLTEVFHLLPPDTLGAIRLREFLLRGGVAVWFLDQAALERSFALMERYADHPMDLADAYIFEGA